MLIQPAEGFLRQRATDCNKNAKLKIHEQIRIVILPSLFISIFCLKTCLFYFFPAIMKLNFSEEALIMLSFPQRGG